MPSVRRTLSFIAAAVVLGVTLTSAFGHSQGVPPHFANMVQNIKDAQQRARAGGRWFNSQPSPAEVQRGRSRVDNSLLPANIDQETVVESHSFAAPLFDGGAFSSAIPHWEFGMSTVVHDRYVRLTPEEQSREGYLWNTVPLGLKSWTAHLGFRVHGNQAHGADGFALWLSTRRAMNGGPLFGIPETDPWEGIGVIFDSFDNDGARDNPMVSVIKGADTAGGYPLQHKSADDFRNTRAGSCIFDFRVGQLDNQVVNMQITYSEGDLRIDLRKGTHETHCLTLNNVQFTPGRHFFGFTGHTGGLADSHDLHYFVLTTHEKDVSEERLAALMADKDVAQGYQAARAAADAATGPVPPDVMREAAASSTAAAAVKPKDFSHHDDRAERDKWKANP